jgi:hypothetical protein
LALKTDKPDAWEKRNPKVERDLRPRTDEATKSTWAHKGHTALPAESGLSYCIRCANAGGELPPNLEFHALALFVFMHVGGQRRNTVTVVSFDHRCVPPAHLALVADKHLIAELDDCHAEVGTSEEDVRTEVLQRIFQSDFSVTRFTRDELRPLYSALRAKELIRDEFRDLAAQAFEERG